MLKNRVSFWDQSQHLRDGLTFTWTWKPELTKLLSQTLSKIIPPLLIFWATVIWPPPRRSSLRSSIRVSNLEKMMYNRHSILKVPEEAKKHLLLQPAVLGCKRDLINSSPNLSTEFSNRLVSCHTLKRASCPCPTVESRNSIRPSFCRIGIISINKKPDLSLCLRVINA